MTWVETIPGAQIEPGQRNMLPAFGTPPTADNAAPGYWTHEPQAFTVYRGAEVEPLRVHYHVVDQFQYVLAGAGRIGRQTLAPGVVQYADRCTPYGPIAPGPDGVAWVTMRAVHDTGNYWMPETRAELASALSEVDGDRRRNLTVDLRAAVADAPPLEWRDAVADADGLRMAVARVPAGASLAVPAIGGDGAFLVVMEGRLAGEGAPGPNGATYAPSGSEPRELVAAEDAQVALLQLPRRVPEDPRPLPSAPAIDTGAT